MGKRIRVYDETGKKFTLIDFYKKCFPQWDQLQTDELLTIAKKDYPHAESLDDVVQQSEGHVIEKVSYAILHLTTCLYDYFAPATINKFKPKVPQDLANPEICAFDAKFRLKKKKERWEFIKTQHRSAIQAVRELKLRSDALDHCLSKDYYGKKIIDLFLKNDPNALRDLERSLSKKKRVDNEKEEVYALTHETIAKKVSKSRDNAPPLEAFLPNGLLPKVRNRMEALLRNQNTEDAKLYSDAVIGKFRVLPNEFNCDFLNETGKLLAAKRQSKKMVIDADTSDEDQDQTEKNQFRDPKDTLVENIEKNLTYYNAIQKLEKELEKPKYDKIRSFYYELKKNPEVQNTELSKMLKIHRNTVPRHIEQLKKLTSKFINPNDMDK